MPSSRGELLLPGQAPVGPVDRAAHGDADALVAPGVLAGALDRRVELDVAGLVLDRARLTRRRRR
jgi:hypothetical protein